MVSALFETRDDLKVFVLDVIGSSPLSGRVDVLTERVDVLTERVDVLTQRVDVLTQRVDALTIRMDVLTERVDQLVVRVASIERILLEERFRNEQRDIKINAMYDMFVQMARDAERQRNLDKVVEVNKLDSDLTRSLLRTHTDNSKIHVTPQRGRPRKGLKENDL